MNCRKPWVIVGLAEVRKRREGLIRREYGNYFYYLGETMGYRGIGFYIKSKMCRKE